MMIGPCSFVLSHRQCLRLSVRSVSRKLFKSNYFCSTNLVNSRITSAHKLAFYVPHIKGGGVLRDKSVIGLSESFIRPVSWFAYQDKKRKKYEKIMTGHQREKEPATLENQIILFNKNMLEYKRANDEHLNYILDLLLQDCDAIEEDQALIIIRSLGAKMIAVKPHDRHTLFLKFLEIFENKDFYQSIIFQNSVLRTKGENNVLQNPVEELKNIQSNLCLTPNKNTYQILVNTCCRLGCTSQAESLIEEMKVHAVDIDESIYSSLLSAYIMQRNTGDAARLMDEMSSSGRKLSLGSYRAMCLSYAALGDEASLMSWLKRTEREQGLSSTLLTEIIVASSLNGHSRHVPKILPFLEGQSTHDPCGNVDLFNATQQLLLHHRLDDALACLDLVHHHWAGVSCGVIFLQQMLKSRIAPQVIMCTAKMLVRKGYLAKSDMNLSNMRVSSLPADYLLELYSTCALEKFEVSNDNLKRLLRKNVADDQKKALISSLRTIDGILGHDWHNAILISWASGIKPWALKHKLTQDQLKFFLEEEVGFNSCQASRFVVAHAISLDDQSFLRDFLAGNKNIEIIPFLVGYELRNLRFVSLPAAAAEVLSACQKVHPHPLHGLNGHLLRFFIQNAKSFEESCRVLCTFQDKNLKVSPKHVDPIIDYIRRFIDSDESRLQELLQSLVTDQQRGVQLNKLTIEELEYLLRERPLNFDVISIQKMLLHKYSHVGAEVKVNWMVQVLLEEGVVIPSELLLDLGKYYVSYEWNLDEACRLLDRISISGNYPSIQFLSEVVSLMISMRKDSGWKELLREQKVQDCIKNSLSSSLKSNLFCQSIVKSLVQRSEEHVLDDLEFLQRQFAKIMPSILEAKCRLMLDGNRMDDVLRLQEKHVQFFSYLPHLLETSQKLMTAELKDGKTKLTKLINLGRKLGKEKAVVTHILMDALESGNEPVFSYFLSRTPRKLCENVLHLRCDLLMRRLQFKELKKLINALKRRGKFNTEFLLFLPLRMAVVQGRSAREVLNLYSCFEEEEVTPSKFTLLYVAEALKSENIPLPFQLPQPEQSSLSSDDIEQFSILHGLKLINSALRLFVKTENEELKKKAVMLMTCSRASELKILLQKLSEIGSVANVEIIANCLDNYVLKRHALLLLFRMCLENEYFEKVTQLLQKDSWLLHGSVLSGGILQSSVDSFKVLNSHDVHIKAMMVQANRKLQLTLNQIEYHASQSAAEMYGSDRLSGQLSNDEAEPSFLHKLFNYCCQDKAELVTIPFLSVLHELVSVEDSEGIIKVCSAMEASGVKFPQLSHHVIFKAENLLQKSNQTIPWKDHP